ncbi:MAG: DNA methyltransferase [Phycisphaerae bacterium]
MGRRSARGDEAGETGARGAGASRARRKTDSASSNAISSGQAGRADCSDAALAGQRDGRAESGAPTRSGRASALLDTRVVYCGDCLEQLKNLPAGCIDLIYIDPPFNSNRNYEVFWGETKEKRAFEDRHASTQAYIDYMRPRCVELARVLKKTGSFYYHCDWIHSAA